jgi:hypothetical protein
MIAPVASDAKESKESKDSTAIGGPVGAFVAGSGDISAICLSSPTIKHPNGSTVHAKVIAVIRPLSTPHLTDHRNVNELMIMLGGVPNSHGC